jgi:methyl-accepting chemotaxis protein
MTLKLRVLASFLFLIALSLVQLAHQLRTTNHAQASLEQFFNGAFVHMESARGIRREFDAARTLAANALSMTSPVESRETLQTFAAIHSRLSQYCNTLKTSVEGARLQQAEIVDVKLGQWFEHSRILLGEKPALAVPAPHLMARLEREISAHLDQLIEVAVADAHTRRGLMQSEMSESSRLSLIIAIIGALLSLGAALLLTRAITNPLRQIGTVMSGLAAGKLETTVPHADRKDEVGIMARAVQVFKANAIERGRLSQQNEQFDEQRSMRSARVEDLINRFDGHSASILDRVRAEASKLIEAASALDLAAKQAVSQTGTARQTVETATGNVSETANATGEMTSSIAAVSEQARRSSEISIRALDEANHTNETIHQLAASANRIGEVVSLIQNIAAQTNLLALNATIEAARAGDAGRGFAVVAHEVKTLAGETAAATNEIAVQISAIQKASADSVTVIERIRATVEDMASMADSVATAVYQQDTNVRLITETIASASGQSLAGVRAMADVESAILATTSTIVDVRSTADNLTQEAQALESEIRSFLQSVKAA